MAALSIGIIGTMANYTSQISDPNRSVAMPKTHFSLSCRISEPEDGQTDLGTRRSKKELRLQFPSKIMMELEKLGKGLGDGMSPKQKGDWKDVMLMSLSFAVLVYISQRIVCAYCTWKSLLQHSSW